MPSIQNLSTDKFSHRVRTLTGILFILLVILLALKPLVLTIDSVYGFFAMEGTLQTNQFNVLQDLSYADLRQVDLKFMAWWSPGQWMVPALFSLLLHIPLGVSCIVVTVLATVAGLIGYRLIFRFFGFDESTTALSVLVILCSANLYINFFVYQGGEILSFAVFPWFVLYVARLKSYNPASFLFVFLLALACFIAKTTMLVYCGAVVIWKIREQMDTEQSWSGRAKNLMGSRVYFLIAGVILASGLGLWYIRNGLHPEFNFDTSIRPDDFLMPLASPIAGGFSIQQLIGRIETIIGGPLSVLFHYLSYTLCIVILLWLLSRTGGKKNLRPYFRLIVYLFVFVGGFLILCYLGNTRVDHHSRHLKLVGFLLIPLIVQMARGWNKYLLRIFIAGYLLYTVAEIVYQSYQWPANRYISDSYFYRNMHDASTADKVDPVTYRKILAWDRWASQPGAARYLFIEGNADLAIDTKSPTIFIINVAEFYNRPFLKSGPPIIAVASRQTLRSRPDFLHFKFPDYNKQVLVDQTEGFLFYRLDP
ncbi:MAG: hypothetical protein ABWZ25_09075 [Chitinophagaceae bacterium]